MKKFNSLQKLVNLISISVIETLVRVQVGNTITDPVTVNSGKTQGVSLSPILFNLVLEKVIKDMKIGPQEGYRQQDMSVGSRPNAGDIVLMEESQDRLKMLFRRINKAAIKE